MRKFICKSVAILLIVSFVLMSSSVSVFSDGNTNDTTGIASLSDIKRLAEIYAAEEFISVISTEREAFSGWENATPEFAYELYGDDFTTVVGSLYHVGDGYVIIDTSYNIVEFANGTPSYEGYQSSNAISGDTKFLYVNAMPAIFDNGIYTEINSLGEILWSLDTTSNTLMYYDPQLQNSSNCIVAAISNLMWHWGNNGYSNLTYYMSFDDVKQEVDTIINGAGGYANDNIPSTIATYVYGKDPNYVASVTNTWYPTFYDVQNEVYSRPCLLGFAAGSGSYDKNVGHMTVCVDAYSNSQINVDVVGVIDGHASYVVYKTWSDAYNDFYSQVFMYN